MTDLGSPFSSKALTKPGSFVFCPKASFSYVVLSACHECRCLRVSQRNRPKCCASFAVHWNIRVASCCFLNNWCKRCMRLKPGVPLSWRIFIIVNEKWASIEDMMARGRKHS